jgi:hypothetical protein
MDAWQGTIPTPPLLLGPPVEQGPLSSTWLQVSRAKAGDLAAPQAAQRAEQQPGDHHPQVRARNSRSRATAAIGRGGAVGSAVVSSATGFRQPAICHHVGFRLGARGPRRHPNRGHSSRGAGGLWSDPRHVAVVVGDDRVPGAADLGEGCRTAIPRR